MAHQTIAAGVGRLALDGSPPRLYLSAETDDVADFDQTALRHWRAEGFDVVYLPYHESRRGAYVDTLHGLGSDMGLGEAYAIVGTYRAPPLRPSTAAPPQPTQRHALTQRRLGARQHSATRQRRVSRRT